MSLVPGTTNYGCFASAQIAELAQKAGPRVEMILSMSPGMKGVDIELRAMDAPVMGFQFADIKPMPEYGYRSFIAQVALRKLQASVLAITYDYKGNIYYGFAKLGKGSAGIEVLSQLRQRKGTER
jgi:hypothetical protein